MKRKKTDNVSYLAWHWFQKQPNVYDGKWLHPEIGNRKREQTCPLETSDYQLTMKSSLKKVLFGNKHYLSEIIAIFALWFWKESPVKVHLAVLNWELGCKSPTVPQQWTPLWLLSINTIVHLDEKALGSGVKSEDQPSSVKMPLHHDVWCR